MTDEGHPADIIVQRWPRHGPEQRRTLKPQDRIMATLAPDARRAFLELEELRNKVAAEREEAFYDLGVPVGIERERRRCRPQLPRACARLAARFRQSIDHTRPEDHEAVLALVAVLAEWATSLVEFHADKRKSRTRRGAYARST